MKKEKELLFKILLILFTPAVIFILAEIGFRSVDGIKEHKKVRKMNAVLTRDIISRKKVYRRIHDFMYYDKNGCFRRMPNVEGLHRSYDNIEEGLMIRINSHGIRGEEILESPSKRVLFLGDSIVFNGGVPLKLTFVYQLEKYLNTGIENREDYNIEVLNFGTTDTGIDQYYSKLKYHGMGLEPDYVFLGVYLNDSMASQGYIGANSLDIFEKFLESGLIARLRFAKYIEKIYRVFKYSNKKELKKRFRWTDRYNQRRFYTDKEELLKLVEEADLDWGSAWEPEGWEKIKFYLEEIRKLCIKKDVKLVVFCFPAEFQVYSEVDWAGMDYPQEQLRDICRTLEIPCFDLLPYLREYGRRRIFADQCHYKAAGNNIITRILLRIIKENKDIFKGLIE
ncbi:SGNH/GDSL hydrolase family protein [Elusimicrobiota bacterium]